MAEHARLTNDRPWLAAHKKAILDGCQWILRERNFSEEARRTTLAAACLRGKFVCDMPDDGQVTGVGYFTYTDAISYLGLHSMARLLSDWGHPEGVGLLEGGGALPAGHRRGRRSAHRQVDAIPGTCLGPCTRRSHEDNYLNGVCGPINLAFGGVLATRRPRGSRTSSAGTSTTSTTAGSENSATANMFYSQDLAIVLSGAGRGSRSSCGCSIRSSPRTSRARR